MSTVTINAVLGDDGLIDQAKIARNLTEDSIASENEKMNKLAQEYANLMEENNELEEPFEPQPTPEPPEETNEEFNMNYGVIEIKWLEGNSYQVADKANDPVINNSITNGSMELIKYDESTQNWISGTEYSYVEGSGNQDNNKSKWANAKVTIDGVDSYFVWIPRYAYRIIYFKDEDSKIRYKNGELTESDAISTGEIVGYSDSRGIVDANGRKVSTIENTTKIMVTKNYFMVHPAFTTEEDYGGGWDTELEGLWVGKYETGDTTVSQPGITCGFGGYNKGIGVMYTDAQSYSQDLKSHMLKKSEWGVVAYLTDSTYGRNGTALTENKSSYTGGGTSNSYINNTEQSSTGNVYGIYDLFGGKPELVAAYYNGTDAQGNISNGSPFASIGGTSDEYSTAYEGEGHNQDIKLYYKYGDATYEIGGTLGVGSYSIFFLQYDIFDYTIDQNLFGLQQQRYADYRMALAIY